MEGVRVCEFDCTFPADWERPGLSPGHFEMLFCQRGRMTAHWADGRTLPLCGREILLLSSTPEMERFHWSEEAMKGVLVAVDSVLARKSLQQICGLLGGPELDAGQVRQLMERQRGCAVLERTAWSDGVFQAIQSLTPEQRRQYCVWKVAEVLYLLCCGGILRCKAPEIYYDRHQVGRVRQVHDYLIEHIHEPVTIERLSRQFQISSTVLKRCFRQIYGRPIRKYVQAYRMRRAAELLTNTRQPVQQISAAVGYESTSQFRAVFQQIYQMSPSQYRAKMSESIDSRPKPFSTQADSEV